MSAQDELQAVSNIILFMRRTQLSGEEVGPFNAAMNWLGQHHQRLQAMVEATPKPEEPSPDPTS